jgi:hypothetical protein
MAARHFTITLGAVAQRLSDVYGDGVGIVDAAHDLPYRQILLQAEVDAQASAYAYVGEVTVTTTDYGVLVPTSATPPVVSIGPFETGPVKLSQLYALGSGAVDLHILAIPF